MNTPLDNKKDTIPIHSLKSYKTWFQIAVVLILSISCIQIQNIYWETLSYEFIEFLQIPKYVLAILSFVLIVRFFYKPRFFILDHDRKCFSYHYPFRSKGFTFDDVEIIRVEGDMTKALLRLKANIRQKFFLRLRNRKLLFVGEYLEGEKGNTFLEKLVELFSVKVEKLHKVGRLRSKEVNLGRYTIEKEISHGGMGKVFLGRDVDTQKQVAVKILPAKLALKDDNSNNFARETRILQRLSHPNIVKVLHVGREKTSKMDVYFFAMECIHGLPLSHYIKQKLLSVEQSVRYVIQIALALDYIHSHRIIHRDIKPANIMIRNEGSCVLIDFGIARDVSIREKVVYKRVFRHRPEISHFVGTVPYMSPEQISSRHLIDYRTDLYSLGVTLYEMLVSERLFKGNEPHVVRSILTSYPSAPSSKNGLVSKELDAIVLKSIARKKSKRYQSGAEFAHALHCWLHGITVRKQKQNLWQNFFLRKTK